MSSSSKTEYMGLNQWVGSDIPTMIDFNTDNSVVDRIVKAHIEDSTKHLTEAEKFQVDTPFSFCSYAGTGESETRIDLKFGFAPKFCIVFAMNAPAGVTDIANNTHYNYFGIASTSGSNIGLSLDGCFLDVSQGSTYARYETTAFNEIGKVYVVIGFR